MEKLQPLSCSYYGQMMLMGMSAWVVCINAKASLEYDARRVLNIPHPSTALWTTFLLSQCHLLLLSENHIRRNTLTGWISLIQQPTVMTWVFGVFVYSDTAFSFIWLPFSLNLHYVPTSAEKWITQLWMPWWWMWLHYCVVEFNLNRI